VRANELDGGVMDLVRKTLITPKAIREMVQILNEDIRMRAEPIATPQTHGCCDVRQIPPDHGGAT
jgi:hypothetical protein